MTETEGIQTYQKNLHLSPSHKQLLAADIDRYNKADNIWEIMRHEFTLPHYEDNPRVQDQIEWFMNNQEFLYRTALRSAPYLYYILQQIRKRHLPAEVALIPIIESSFNPFAYSSAGASGLWQMMPRTATGYGIKQNWWYDGRRDIVASTKAALNYLAYLDNFFEGNWLYAVAAYDTGEGNILSAIKKNARDGINTSYWTLPLAQETRDYIPKLLALAIIIGHPEKYPVQLPYVRNAPYLAQIDIGAQIDLNHAASLAGLSLKKIKELNPGYNHVYTDPNGPFKLILPIESVEKFSANLTSSPLSLHFDWINYKIKNGDSYVSLAKRFKTTTSALQKTNPKLANNLPVGQNIIIPRKRQTLSKTILEAEKTHTVVSSINQTEEERGLIKRKLLGLTANNTKSYKNTYTLQPGDTLYMVRNSDDLNKIAHRFHTSTASLLAVNNIHPNQPLVTGDQLIIPTHKQNGMFQKISPGETLYLVRPGDTLEIIANKYKVQASVLRLTNLLQNSQLKEGDEIIIPARV